MENVRGHFHNVILYIPAITHITPPAVPTKCAPLRDTRNSRLIDWYHIVWSVLGWRMNALVCPAASLMITHVRIS